VQAFLPGVQIEDIDLTSKENILFIKGNRKEEKLADGTQVHIREMFHGEFSRSLEFPFLIDSDNIKAEFKDGVVGILVPRREDDKPKKISIQSIQNK
jgi:HSP20 family protein